MIELIEDTRMIIRQSSFSPLKHSLSQDYEILTDSIVLFNHIFESLFRENISKFHFHELMKNEVNNLAKIFNFSSRMEYRVDKKKLDNKRNGFIDVVWFDSDTLVAPIEIDSSPRKKSINKVLAVDSIFKFWIYYGKSLSKALNRLNKRDPEKLITMIMFDGISFSRSENSL
jgi:hypothetical protein